MTPEKQNIAIAEACGWSRIVNKSTIQIDGLWMGYPPVNPIVGMPERIPEYVEDLNAMHEAEKILTNAQRRLYAHLLIFVHPLHYDPLEKSEDSSMSLFLIASMTAAQRAEAFLRAIGRWERDE